MFKNQLLIYQRAASHTILSINSSSDSEGFYNHILFNYYPYLVDKFWREYKVDLGVFNLQRFERKNKESKKAARNFYNGRHNICTQLLNRIYDRFYLING